MLNSLSLLRYTEYDFCCILQHPGKREKQSESDRESFKKCQPKFPLRVIQLKYSEIQLKMELNIGMLLEFYEK